jgi:hypothetical protein
MPGKLTDNDTRVSSLFQYMRPRPNNLILTNTIVSGDFQVKASVIIHCYVASKASEGKVSMNLTS